MYYLSPEAQKAVENAAGRDLIYRAQQERARERMQAGPYLSNDGYTLVVPSEWYNAKAADFWRSHGFRWNSDSKTWTRDTRRPYEAKTYTAQAWLESTRREFYGYWPNLLPDDRQCQRCDTAFHPLNEYQVYCVPCAAIAQAERRLYDENR